jgi:mono/diheme cytochrome c family protein
VRILVFAAALAAAVPLHAQNKDDAQVKRGRYLVQIGGCNDCHTPDYPQKGGKVPESEWLTGDALGWRGPWGTTYATNLRLYMQDLTEDQWVKKAKALNARPPMPWFNVRAMTSADLRAFYRYVRHLGPAGKPAPAYVPSDKTPSGPVVTFPAPPK